MITVSLSNLNGENGFFVRENTPPDPSAGTGSSVSGAGDINGDGFDDLILGPDRGRYQYGRTAVYIVYGSSETNDGSLGLADLTGNSGFVIESANPNSTIIRTLTIAGADYSIETGTAESNAGFSVSGLGDVNGDGIDDFIIGAPRRPLNIPFSPPTSAGAGQSYIVFGRSEGFSDNFSLAELDGETGFVIESNITGSLAGQSVSNAGDFNGDGFDDILLGAPGLASSGTSYLIFGTDQGFDQNLSLSNLNGSNGFALSGGRAGDEVGASVSGAGDINGDGLDDLIVAAPDGNDTAGITYVVFGTDTDPNRSLDLDSLDGTNGFTIFGEATNDFLGRSVSEIGDFNGDGFDDLIIGSVIGPNSRERSSYPGESHVIFGQADGFPAALNVNEINGNNGFSIIGEERASSGRSVSGAGDINGDGLSDIVIGAPKADGFAGASYVLFGQRSSIEPVIDLASLSPSQGFTINGGDTYDYIGESVSNAGDINGDGIDDLVVGSGGAFILGAGSAQSYIIFGNASPKLDLDVNQDGLNSTATFSQGAVSLAKPDSVAITDANTATLVGATVTIINPLDNASEILAADVDSTDITATYDSATSILTLSGKDTLENYQQVLQTVTYSNTADHPNLTDRSIQIVVDDGADFSNESAIATTTVTFELLNPIDGTNAPDTLLGSREADRIIGLGGGDLISGRSGNDVLAGRAGSDQIFGGNGADSLNGNRGRDWLNGGNGSDLIRAGQGNDQLFGNRGDDILQGNSGDDVLIGGSGNDSLNGGDGFDLLNSGSGDDALKGGRGDDQLFGGVGDDTLRGGNGVDLLQGSQGSDRLDGGFGSDSLFGGAGSDQFVLRASDGSDTIFDYQDGIDGFVLDGLDFEELEIRQGVNQTIIQATATTETLATLIGVQASAIEQTDFSSSG